MPQAALISKLKFLDTLTQLGQAVLMESEAQKPTVKLSPTEQRIVNCIGTGKVPGKTIAKALGREGVSNSLWGTLATLVGHSFLLNEKGGDGYSVNPFWAHLVEEEEEKEKEGNG